MRIKTRFNSGSFIFFSMSCVLIMSGALFLAGARINTSPSIPVGLYWLSNQPVKKGEYVIFCPPETAIFKQALARGYLPIGFCPLGSTYLMKQVVATTGDRIAISSEGVVINGHPLAFSKPLLKDSKGRPLSIWEVSNYRLKSLEVLLMTNQSPLSFDARYFGLLTKTELMTVIKPIIVWVNAQKGK
ncbi:conjugative transfer signal peptidase TraF [Legionella fairfieldensis]|uniref:conjugative transfer signal peptidase TraF n=1 Tax=Legionella fairfieldensis TaxID=45064 RepID=UPI000687A353|nr:conjugative transfer signal peptidase TraF [Legionella fairfieldensis]